MKNTCTSVEPEDMSAYVDGALDKDRRIHVEDAVAVSQDLAVLLTSYVTQSTLLKKLRSDVLREAIPEKLLETVSRTPRRG